LTVILERIISALQNDLADAVEIAKNKRDKRR
jgi:hypothetical protein